MGNQSRPKFAVVYGDTETLENYRSQVELLAGKLRMKIRSWHSDSEGTRNRAALDEADGLVSALADCVRFGAALFVPYAFDDMPGEQAPRLIGHWLYRRGLPLFLGPMRFQWDRPADEVDAALRRLLDVSHGLDAAVVARGAAPSLETLMDQITGKEVCPEPPPRPIQPGPTALPGRARHAASTAPGQPRPAASTPVLMIVRICREIDIAAGRQVPAEPDPAAPWTIRQPQVFAYARWLQGHTSQAQIAEALNGLGVRPFRASIWTPTMVSRLLRQETKAVRLRPTTGHREDQ